MSTTQNPGSGRGRPSGRIAAAVVALVLGGLLLLATLAAAVPMILNHFTDLWNGFADLSTVALPFGQDQNSPDPVTTASYAGVLLTSSEALALPRALLAWQSALTLLVLLTGGLMLVLVAVRLLRGRPFTRLLRWGMVVLGLLIVVFATVGPQLEALALDTASQELGFPIYDYAGDGILTATTPDSIMLNLWDPIWVVGRFELVPLVIGGLVAMFGFFIADGERIQRDTDGLV